MMAAMLAYEEALAQLLERVPPGAVVRVPLEKAAHRVLAEDVRADLDLPPFNKSTMDGYALRSADVSAVPACLEVMGAVAAGTQVRLQVGPGQAAQIMTGAPLPPGADAVQVLEKTRRIGSSMVQILEPVERGRNISPQGEEIGRGLVALERGRVLGPAEIGILATFGRTQAAVYAAPTVAVISTGDEIVDISQKPEVGQIRNSNAYMLGAQCRALGLDAEILPAVPDDPAKTEAALTSGLEKDVVLFAGGVSMGEYDYVHQVLADAGVDVFFHKVAIKPGKPVLVGRKNNRLVFGLPGNPVSAFVTFELLVRPAVRKWMGYPSLGLRRVRAELLQEVRQKPGRMFFKPARTCWKGDHYQVEPMETKGSADLVGFSRADSLLVVEARVERVPKGSVVQVLLLERA